MAQYIVSFPGLGLEQIPVRRIAFSFEIGTISFQIYWYGIIIALAVLLCMTFAVRQSWQYGLRQDDVLDFLLILVPSILIGARLYYVAFSWSEFEGNVSRIFNIRYGGLAFYGGVLAGVIAAFVVAKWKKIRVHRF